MHNNININVSGPVQPTSTYKTKVLKGNHSFASQVTEPNMKYVIKHDFILDGGTVTIPEGCLLEFDGGSISSGALVGQNTILIYYQPLNDILTATLEGTWRHESGVKADEEDITDLNGELKFKDKAYNPLTYNGMGRVYLRKNMVNGVNTLTQDMFYKGEVGSREPNTNTIFIIQYDYVIDSANDNTITIPANCILKFEGGSISNGALVGNNTILIYNQELDVVMRDVVREGTFVYNNTLSADGETLIEDGNIIKVSPQIADEEDIHFTSNKKLQFKDRPNTDGMGRKILRKNIVNGVNVLTQDMMPDVNTIYVIQYDFTLGGNITVPANCVLEFDGGSLKNGTITGNYSLIKKANFGIFDNVILSGTWQNYSCDLSWWGCVPYDENNEFDNSPKINNALSSAIHVITISKLYGISSPHRFSGREIIGNVNWGRFQCGFVANADFDLTQQYDGVAIKGMFYYAGNNSPKFTHLTFDGKFRVDYCLQHISGYPNSDIFLEDVGVKRARFACIFQSANEQCIMKHVYCTESNIGFLLSQNRPVAGDYCIPTGNSIGAMNILQLNECFAGDCNHGFVIVGGSNTALINCKSGHNSRVGVISWNANVTLYNFYTERDGMCNFWRNPDTGELSSAEESYVCPALLADANRTIGGVSVTGRLDGFNATASLYGDVYYRAPIYLYQSNVTLINPFLSDIHRGGRNQSVIKPTVSETTYGGVDAYILTTESTIKVDNPYLYNVDAKYPWKFFIELMRSRFSNIVASQWDFTIYKKYPSVFVTALSEINVLAAANKNLDNLRENTYYGLVHNVKTDYNNDVHSRKIGIGTNTTVRRLISFSQLPIVDTYNGAPLSIRNYDNVQFLGTIVYSREEWLSKFDTSRIDSIKVRAYFKVLNKYTGNNGSVYFSLYFGSSQLSQDYIYVGRASSGRFASPEKGSIGVCEEILPVLPIIPEGVEDNWQYAVLTFNVISPASDDIAVSDIYIYDVEDKEVAIPQYQSYFFESGSTTERPVNVLLPIGFRYFDKKLNIPIFVKEVNSSTGIATWVDATGVSV